MNPILQQQVQDFIRQHEWDHPGELVLKFKEIGGVPIKTIVAQIEGRRKTKSKIPVFYQNKQLIYPPTSNLEQSSSQATALFKSRLMKGRSLVDLTGGFGVDSYFFSRIFSDVTHVEPDDKLLDIVRHNHAVLGVDNITYINSDAEQFLHESQRRFDVVYIDPSRRDAARRKVVTLSDCSPDTTAILPEILKRTSNVIIKASPLLDIQQGLRDLKFVSKVFIVAVDNECEELLFCVNKDFKGDEELIAADISDDGTVSNSLTFTLSEEQNARVIFSDPLQYLYEPSTAILKAGAFRLVSERFSLNKLSANTHYYTSERLENTFPGRVFRLDHFVKPNPKELMLYLPDGKANITTRNYPQTPEALRKILKIKDGGDHFVIGFSGRTKKFLTIASRIK